MHNDHCYVINRSNF